MIDRDKLAQAIFDAFLADKEIFTYNHDLWPLKIGVDDMVDCAELANEILRHLEQR